MNVKPEVYVRVQSAFVEAIQVGDDYYVILAAANWCGGYVGLSRKDDYFVVVDRKQAYPKDWIVKCDERYEVYSDFAFKHGFKPLSNVVINVPIPDFKE